MESAPADGAECRAIVQVLAVVLERLVGANSHLEAGQHEETKFHGLRVPAIGILQYLERIRKYASCSGECFVLALIYIDRLVQRNDYLLTSLNVHRVVLAAVLTAAKFLDDAFCNNAHFAGVGGVLVGEMNALECEFLFKIDFGLRVEPQMFNKYKDELISQSTALGLNIIESCSDEELRSRQTARQQGEEMEVMACHQHQNYEMDVIPCEGNLLQTYSQGDTDPAPTTYPNPAAAPTCHQDRSAPASHYPTDALRRSMIMEQEPQPTAVTALNLVLPFPTLPRPVSAQPQAQAPPAGDPAELYLAY